MTSRPCACRTTASSSASVVLPAAGGPSTATRVGCAIVTDPTASARRLSSSTRVPLSNVLPPSLRRECRVERTLCRRCCPILPDDALEPRHNFGDALRVGEAEEGTLAKRVDDRGAECFRIHHGGIRLSTAESGRDSAGHDERDADVRPVNRGQLGRESFCQCKEPVLGDVVGTNGRYRYH